VYGDLGDHVATEASPTVPRTAYGADKLGSELHGAVGWTIHGVPNTGLRFFNVYGPRQDPSSPYSGVISIFASRIASGQSVTLHGDGRQTRDFVHVSDVVAHLLTAMAGLQQRPSANVLNVCTGQEHSIGSLAALLGRLCGAAPDIHPGPARDGDITRSAGDPARAVALLAVTARVTLEQGLANLLSRDSPPPSSR